MSNSEKALAMVKEAAEKKTSERVDVELVSQLSESDFRIKSVVWMKKLGIPVGEVIANYKFKFT